MVATVSCRLLGDADVERVSPGAAVDAMRAAVSAAYQGELGAPPRVSADVGELSYTFTVGSVAGGVSGFRAYRAGRAGGGDQLVAVWDRDGCLIGVIVGGELGARRTGALGAVSVDALARPDAGDVAIIGSGTQAWTQLWAASAVRTITSVRVFSPRAEHRDDFAEQASTRLHLNARAVDCAAAALASADIVILATRSTVPVIEARDVEVGAHVVTVGPKLTDAHETPLELLERAALISCDSPTQATSYGREFFTGGAQLVDLGAILTGDHPGRQSPEDITLHCSVGLAGTEVVLAHEVIKRAGAADAGGPA